MSAKKPTELQIKTLRMVQGGHITRIKHAATTEYLNSRGAPPLVLTMRSLLEAHWIEWTRTGERSQQATLTAAGRLVLE